MLQTIPESSQTEFFEASSHSPSKNNLQQLNSNAQIDLVNISWVWTQDYQLWDRNRTVEIDNIEDLEAIRSQLYELRNELLDRYNARATKILENGIKDKNRQIKYVKERIETIKVSKNLSLLKSKYPIGSNWILGSTYGQIWGYKYNKQKDCFLPLVVSDRHPTPRFVLLEELKEIPDGQLDLLIEPAIDNNEPIDPTDEELDCRILKQLKIEPAEDVEIAMFISSGVQLVRSRLMKLEGEYVKCDRDIWSLIADGINRETKTIDRSDSEVAEGDERQLLESKDSEPSESEQNDFLNCDPNPDHGDCSRSLSDLVREQRQQKRVCREGEGRSQRLRSEQLYSTTQEKSTVFSSEVEERNDAKEKEKEIIIDPEFRSLIPPLTPDERSQLRENLLADGCRDPLVIWEGILIDGHNRYALCKELNLEFKTAEIELDDRASVIDWIINNQLGRRNLKAEQKKYIQGKKYNEMKNKIPNSIGKNQYSEVIYQNEGQAQEVIHQNEGQAQEVIHQNEDLPKIRTAEKLSREFGCGKATIERSGKFAANLDKIGDWAGEDLKIDILNGSAKLTDAQISHLASITEDEAEKVREIITSVKNGEKASVVISELDPLPVYTPGDRVLLNKNQLATIVSDEGNLTVTVKTWKGTSYQLVLKSNITPITKDSILVCGNIKVEKLARLQEKYSSLENAIDENF